MTLVTANWDLLENFWIFGSFICDVSTSVLLNDRLFIVFVGAKSSTLRKRERNLTATFQWLSFLWAGLSPIDCGFQEIRLSKAVTTSTQLFRFISRGFIQGIAIKAELKQIKQQRFMQIIFIDAFESAWIPINTARRGVKQSWWRVGHKFA